MKTVLVFAGLLALTQAHLIPSPWKSSRIVNGDEVEAGEIPYQVSLQNAGSSFHFCGGSIMNEKYVITAAHCVVSKTAKQIKVIAGTVSLEYPAQTYKVEKIIVHEDYDEIDSWHHDIALLLVDREFVMTSLLSFVPLASPEEEIAVESKAIVSGWGALRQGGSGPIILQKATIHIVSQTYCKEKYEYSSGLTIYDTQICARHPDEEKGACNGDSGGPLTVNGKLVGIVSWSRGCADMIYPTVYTRVSEYRDWINDNIM